MSKTHRRLRGHRPGRRRTGHGRKPPNGLTARHTTAAGATIPHGYTEGAWGSFYRVILPLRGQDKRLFFNCVSDWGVAAAGLLGAILGFAAMGVLGAFLGLGGAIILCDQAMVRGCYIRR
ncbi:hypothetical protein [Singulisphaera acidiphila]|uniref:DCD domain-containing protein n=1 Tax=Singulisphaera acidiphila (strain ATCC BAA-1392 / DSM 18658 / VKM B-2454 / MOB10) TaxID=886293 RepID=L0DCD8_SINAD|nr:hypothetical protein [Singulisphaera acidiphila]AGA26331.1 hypothetical protein Sinac_1975 [Singulisphaera acidiphila DSM 18658]